MVSEYGNRLQITFKIGSANVKFKHLGKHFDPLVCVVMLLNRR